MKKRLLKKFVKNLRADSPARFRYNYQVEKEWLKWARRIEMPVNPQGWSPYYTIDAKGVTKHCDFWAWTYLFEFKYKLRKIALTEIKTDAVTVAVSTVFLGMDHGFFGLDEDLSPVLFETMIFGGKLDRQMDRYASKASALAGHSEMIKRVLSPEGGLILMPEAFGSGAPSSSFPSSIPK